jgi:hypothetical protein
VKRQAKLGHWVLTDRSQAMTVFEIELAIERLGGLSQCNPICVQRPRLIAAGEYSATEFQWDIVYRDEQLAALKRKIMEAATIGSKGEGIWQATVTSTAR